MKSLLVFLVFCGLVGFAFAEPAPCSSPICVIESSWDGTQFFNPGETYWLKAEIPRDERLHVKIFYYDNTIVHEKTYDPDEEGIVLVEYTSPDKEDSLSFYRVAMTIDGDPSKNAGAIFRIGDSYPTDLFHVQTNSSLYHAKIGDSIQLESHNNNRWGMPLAPHYQFNATLFSPDGNIVFEKTITTDEYGDFAYPFSISHDGFYKLVLNDKEDKQQVRIFPFNFDTTRTIHEEGRDFEIDFGPPHESGISFSIHDIQFDKHAKSLTVYLENPEDRQVRGDIKIPHELLNGNMTAIMDDTVRSDFRIKDISDYSWTIFKMSPGNHTLQITGTTAIPEFQTIAAMILAVSIVPILLISKFRRLLP